MQEPALTTIETARLQLRPMRGDDFDALLHIFTDPKVMASFGGELFTPAQMHGWLNRNLEHQRSSATASSPSSARPMAG